MTIKSMGSVVWPIPRSVTSHALCPPVSLNERRMGVAGCTAAGVPLPAAIRATRRTGETDGWAGAAAASAGPVPVRTAARTGRGAEMPPVAAAASLEAAIGALGPDCRMAGCSCGATKRAWAVDDGRAGLPIMACSNTAFLEGQSFRSVQLTKQRKRYT